VQQASRAGESLGAITRAVATISNMNTQIATAAEEQSHVAEEINRNILNITRVVDETAEGASNTATASENLLKLSGGLQALLKQCFH
jgi:methyl-accepting chemotaxis protein